jgi:hypothetical protein
MMPDTSNDIHVKAVPTKPQTAFSMLLSGVSG